MYPPGFTPYAPFPPRRSAIPKVIGILAIVFSVIGVGGSAIWTFGPMSDIKSYGLEPEMGSMVTWLLLWFVISFGLFVVHLLGGIFAIQYKPLGLRLLGIYAISAITLVVVDLILNFALMPSHFENGAHDIRFSVTVMRTAFECMAAPWPIIVLVLSKSRRAKAACNLT